MAVVAMSRVRVVRGLLMIAFRMVLGGFTMMPRRVIVVLRSLHMVLCRMLGHDDSPFEGVNDE